MALAWITGASSGIGRAVSLELARRGWKVVASSRDKSNLNSLATEASDFSGQIVPCPLDITMGETVRETVEKIEGKDGPIDLAVLNAGTYNRFDVSEFSSKYFRDHIDLNLMGTVHCLDPLLQFMRRRSRGHIAVVSSLTAYRGLPYASAYGATKAALTNMCEGLKPELDFYGINITVIHPGFVKTPLTDRNQFFMPFLIDAEDAACRIVDGLERKKFEIAFPKRFAFLLKIASFLPYRLYFKLVRQLVKA
ncbi:MAG: oxidoreductase [Rhodospirillaceae bacterium]|jgi:short-subunit dehydrogenase|nr:oxidoreductase [Rhodospirillaceae bacterium]